MIVAPPKLLDWKPGPLNECALLVWGAYLLQILLAHSFLYELDAADRCGWLAAFCVVAGSAVLVWIVKQRTCVDRDRLGDAWVRSALFSLLSLHAVTVISADFPGAGRWSHCNGSVAFLVFVGGNVWSLLAANFSHAQPRTTHRREEKVIVLVLVLAVAFSFGTRLQSQPVLSRQVSGEARDSDLPRCCRVLSVQRVTNRIVVGRPDAAISLYCTRGTCVIEHGRQGASLLRFDARCDQLERYGVSRAFTDTGFPLGWAYWAVSALLLLAARRCFPASLVIRWVGAAAAAPFVGTVLQRVLHDCARILWGCEATSWLRLYLY